MPAGKKSNLAYPIRCKGTVDSERIVACVRSREPFPGGANGLTVRGDIDIAELGEVGRPRVERSSYLIDSANEDRNVAYGGTRRNRYRSVKRGAACC